MKKNKFKKYLIYLTSIIIWLIGVQPGWADKNNTQPDQKKSASAAEKLVIPAGHRPVDEILDKDFIDKLRYYYKQEYPEFLPVFNKLLSDQTILWVDDFKIPTVPGFYDEKFVYLNRYYPEPGSALIELLSIRVQKRGRTLAEKEDNLISSDNVDLTDEDFDIEQTFVKPRKKKKKKHYPGFAKKKTDDKIDPGGKQETDSMALPERNFRASERSTAGIYKRGENKRKRVFKLSQIETEQIIDADNKAKIETFVNGYPFAAIGEDIFYRHTSLRLALSSYIRSKSASFLPATVGYVNNAKLRYNNNKGFYVSIAPVPVLAHLSGHVARELFFIDAFPQMGAGGRLTRAKPVRIIPRGRETGEEVRVSVLLPPLKQGRKLQLPNIMNGSVYDFGFKRYGLKVDQQGLLTSEKGTSDYIRITYTIKKMTENSRLDFSKEETNWMKAESAAIPEPIKEGLQLAKRSSMSGQQKMELVVSIINKYFAYQTGKIKIALPQGRTWGQFLERYILENKRLLCDCDILAAYSSIFARELGLENAVLIGYANTSDLSRLISDENHAALAVKIEGKWLIFEPTLYTLRAYGIRPDSSSILEQDIKDLEVRLKVFRKDLKKNAAKIRKIEKKIKRLQRAQKREDRKKPLLATRHKVDFFNISKDLAQRLDKKLDYAVGIFRGGKVFLPLLSGYGMPVPGQTNLGELIDYIKTIGIKIGISGINAASLEHLLVQLTDKDPARRIEAARILGGYGPAAGQSLAALVKCLEDPGIVDEETAAPRSARDNQAGNPSFSSGRRKARPERSERVAAMAAESIIAISGLPLINEENIPFLIRLADNFFERNEESFSEWERKRDDFIKMGDPVQEELLKTARTHPVPATRMFALKMLEPFAHQPKTIQGLIDILSLNTLGENSSERTEIHNIFKNIATEKKNYFLDAVPESSRENMDMLCKFLILNNEFYFLNTSKLLKNQVKRAFLKVKKKLNKLNKEELRNKLTSLAVNTSCSSQLRIEAVKYLKQSLGRASKWFNSPYQQQILNILLYRITAGLNQTREDNYSWINDIEILGQVGQKKEADFLFALIRHPGSEFEIKQKSAESIWTIVSYSGFKNWLAKQDNRLKVLIDLLYLQKDHEAWEKIASRITKLGGEAKKGLIISLNDPTTDKVSIACLLGRMEAKEAVGVIINLIEDNVIPGHELGTVLDALIQIKTPQALNYLINKLEDISVTQAQDNINAYISVLGRSGISKAVPGLKETALKNPDLTENVLTALAQISHKSAATAMIDIVKKSLTESKGKVTVVQTKAFSLLAQRADQQSMDYLRSVLKNKTEYISYRVLAAGILEEMLENPANDLKQDTIEEIQKALKIYKNTR